MTDNPKELLQALVAPQQSHTGVNCDEQHDKLAADGAYLLGSSRDRNQPEGGDIRVVVTSPEGATQGCNPSKPPEGVAGNQTDGNLWSADGNQSEAWDRTLVAVLPQTEVFGSEGLLTANDVAIATGQVEPSSHGDDDQDAQAAVANRRHRRSHSDGYSKSNQELKTNDPDKGLLMSNGRNPSRTVSQGGLRHRICIEEVVPAHSTYLTCDMDNMQGWKTDLDLFSSKKQQWSTEKNLPKSVRRYYKLQDELITAYENLQHGSEDGQGHAEEQERLHNYASLLAKITFFINLVLLIAKSVAAVLSGSLAVISSVIDSAVDLVSGALIWWSNRAVKRRDIYKYPQGRTKLEPIAIVVLSVVMSLASVQLIREAIEQIIHYSNVMDAGPNFDTATIVITSCTVVTKFILWLVCRRVKSPSVQVLAQDHRNDVFSNSIAIICGLLGDRVWPFADPIGAIIISFYIIASWYLTGWEQIKMLTGVTARPDFLKKITWIALNHHSCVLKIDTVRAFHFGNNFLVEVDIVLPEDMSVREGHDIGESLQHKIEKLPEVERAFVHLDYETEHSPFSEHKQV